MSPMVDEGPGEGGAKMHQSSRELTVDDRISIGIGVRWGDELREGEGREGEGERRTICVLAGRVLVGPSAALVRPTLPLLALGGCVRGEVRRTVRLRMGETDNNARADHNQR